MEQRKLSKEDLVKRMLAKQDERRKPAEKDKAAEARRVTAEIAGYIKNNMARAERRRHSRRP